MDYFRILSLRLIFIFVAFLPNGMRLTAQEIEAFRIRVGTLEVVEEPKRRGYVFRSEEGEEEFFVVAPDQNLTSKKVEMAFPYPAGLQPIGFKLDNDAEYLYKTPSGVRSELATAQAAMKEHPDRKAVTWLFEGEAGSRIEIAIRGSTPVFRTDLKIGERNVTLWAIRKAAKEL